MPELYLIRHGETFLNHLSRMQGWVDSQLTNHGIDQAMMIGNKLANVKFKAVFSSDLGRAKQTTKLITHAIHYPGSINYTQNLRETNFGSFDALPIKDVWNKITANTPFQNQNDIVADGGMKEVRTLMLNKDPEHLAESYDDVILRWQNFIQQIENQHFAENDKILVITHGTFLRTIFEKYGAYIVGDRNAPQNCSQNILKINNGQISLVEYNRQL